MRVGDAMTSPLPEVVLWLTFAICALWNLIVDGLAFYRKWFR